MGFEVRIKLKLEPPHPPPLKSYGGRAVATCGKFSIARLECFPDFREWFWFPWNMRGEFRATKKRWGQARCRSYESGGPKNYA